MVLLRQLWANLSLRFAAENVVCRPVLSAPAGSWLEMQNASFCPRPSGVRICILTAFPGVSWAPLSLGGAPVKYLITGLAFRKVSSNLGHSFPMIRIKRERKKEIMWSWSWHALRDGLSVTNQDRQYNSNLVNRLRHLS